MKMVLGLLLLLFSFNIFALGPFHLEGYGSFGYGTAEVDGEAKSPSMGVYEIGGTAGYNFIPLFYVGATAGFQNIIQFSDTSRSHGNRKGNRFIIAPTIGFNFLGFHAKYEYRMLGDYNLSKDNSAGQEVVYTSGAGHRLTGQYTIFPFLKLGAYIELNSFDKVEIGGSESSLNNDFKFNHYGLVVSFIL